MINSQNEASIITAIHEWIKDDVRLAVKMCLEPRDIKKLALKINAAQSLAAGMKVGQSAEEFAVELERRGSMEGHYCWPEMVQAYGDAEYIKGLNDGRDEGYRRAIEEHFADGETSSAVHKDARCFHTVCKIARQFSNGQRKSDDRG